MKFNLLAFIAWVVFSITLTFQTAEAQSTKIIPAKEASLIAHLVKEANEPDSHSKNDVYLLATIGKTEYTAELKSGKIVSQRKAANASGGIYGEYAEVTIDLLDKSKQQTAQGAGQVLKVSRGQWKRIAMSEGDYQCNDLKGISKSVLKNLKVECN
jgi:hypothetical protein